MAPLSNQWLKLGILSWRLAIASEAAWLDVGGRENRERGEANGRIRRATLAEIKAAELAQRREETALVLAQPHRRATADPTHPCAGTAIGRLLLPHLGAHPQETQILYDAADAWRCLVRKLWCDRGAKDVNTALEYEPEDKAPGPSTDELSEPEIDARARALADRVDGLRRVLRAASPEGFSAMHDTALFDRDPLAGIEGEAVRTLERLAIELRLVKAPRRAA